MLKKLIDLHPKFCGIDDYLVSVFSITMLEIITSASPKHLTWTLRRIFNNMDFTKTDFQETHQNFYKLKNLITLSKDLTGVNYIEWSFKEKIEKVQTYSIYLNNGYCPVK